MLPVFVDFPNVSEHFLKTSEDKLRFPKTYPKMF